MNVCEITRLSQYAARRLQPGTTGTVHSAYEKSVNLRVPDGLVCVQAAGTAQSPLTLAAWLSPAALAALALEPGMDMTVRGSMLCFGNGVQLSFARAERTAHTLRPLLQPERLAELLETLRRSGLEPKRLRLVQHDAASAPSLLLLESRRGGRPGLAVEPTLLLRDADGRETGETRRIYFRDKE